VYSAEDHVLFPVGYEHHLHIKSKVFPVIFPGDLHDWEVWRIPYYLDNRLTDCGEVLSITHWPCSAPRNIPLYLNLVFISDRGLVWLKGWGELTEFSWHIGFWTRDPLSCNIVPQPLCYRVPIKWKQEHFHHCTHFFRVVSFVASAVAGREVLTRLLLQPTPMTVLVSAECWWKNGWQEKPKPLGKILVLMTFYTSETQHGLSASKLGHAPWEAASCTYITWNTVL
jgi:hypothetical protein